MDTDITPRTITDQNWTASVTHRIALSDGRVIYAHYAADTYGSTDFRLEVVTIDHRPTMESVRYNLTPPGRPRAGDADDFVPDVLPEWVRSIIDTATTPTPLKKD